MRRLFAREPWMADAACRGMDPALWVPDRGATRIDEMKGICRTCPVIVPCRDYGMSLDHREAGIYGGLSGQDRRRIRRRGTAHVA